MAGQSELAEEAGQAGRSELAEVAGMVEQSELAEEAGMVEQYELAEEAAMAGQPELVMPFEVTDAEEGVPDAVAVWGAIRAIPGAPEDNEALFSTLEAELEAIQRRFLLGSPEPPLDLDVALGPRRSRASVEDLGIGAAGCGRDGGVEGALGSEEIATQGPTLLEGQNQEMDSGLTADKDPDSHPDQLDLHVLPAYADSPDPMPCHQAMDLFTNDEGMDAELSFFPSESCHGGAFSHSPESCSPPAAHAPGSCLLETCSTPAASAPGEAHPGPSIIPLVDVPLSSPPEHSMGPFASHQYFDIPAFNSGGRNPLGQASAVDSESSSGSPSQFPEGRADSGIGAKERSSRSLPFPSELGDVSLTSQPSPGPPFGEDIQIRSHSSFPGSSPRSSHISGHTHGQPSPGQLRIGRGSPLRNSSFPAMPSRGRGGLMDVPLGPMEQLAIDFGLEADLATSTNTASASLAERDSIYPILPSGVTVHAEETICSEAQAGPSTGGRTMLLETPPSGVITLAAIGFSRPSPTSDPPASWPGPSLLSSFPLLTQSAMALQLPPPGPDPLQQRPHSVPGLELSILSDIGICRRTPQGGRTAGLQYAQASTEGGGAPTWRGDAATSISPLLAQNAVPPREGYPRDALGGMEDAGSLALRVAAALSNTSAGTIGGGSGPMELDGAWGRDDLGRMGKTSQHPFQPLLSSENSNSQVLLPGAINLDPRPIGAVSVVVPPFVRESQR